LEKGIDLNGQRFDRSNAFVGGLVFLFTFIVYWLTVAPTLSYWDCGEFIACAYILGIPHPPGSPLFIVLGRVFSILPFAADICYRINIISVLSSAMTVLFGYLVVVRIIRFWFTSQDGDVWKKIIPYAGGIIGALFMAFSNTYWANAVEAEVYGLSMMLMTMILWLALMYYEKSDTAAGKRIIVLACFLAMLGISVHLTTFLIMPVAAIFFILKKGAPQKAWIVLCSFFVVELLMMILFSNGRGGYSMFILASIVFMLITAYLVYKYINWPVLISIGAFSMVMIGYYQFVYGLIIGAAAMILLSIFYRKSDWKTGLAILLAVFIGYSFHLFIPIRSAHNPRIDENNPSRNFSMAPWAFFDGQNETFINYLDRKQYGSELMVERSFKRRGTWAHQFGRHAHMGFWSYFETQYGLTPIFGIVFLLGLVGMVLAIRRKVEVGLPFLILLFLGTAGLVLYMNFADGIKYNAQTGDAYMEVRNRDYFFTPGFAFFGLAIGLGAAALMELVRQKFSSKNLKTYKKPAMAVMSLLILTPGFPLANNYFGNDHSQNYFPKMYSENILDTCEKDAILFTSGDNDTFPLWCVQEVYGYRKDVRVVNLSLFNTDWYVWQMKNLYDVPISLDEDQIVWESFEVNGRVVRRPEEPFTDRPRKRRTYLIPLPYEGRVVKLQDMMVDEVVLENRWRYPIYFSSEPYAESPLNLRNYTVTTGMLYKLDTVKREAKINTEEGYRLYTEVYNFDGLDNSDIYREENATGVMLAVGFNALRLADAFQRGGDKERAYHILEMMIEKYPEFYQAYSTLSAYTLQEGDTTRADALLIQAEDYLTMLNEKNPENLFYLSDLGLSKFHQGKIEEGLENLWQAFEANPSNGYGYRKLMQALYETRRSGDIIRATQWHAEYKNNLNDPMVKQILGGSQGMRP